MAKMIENKLPAKFEALGSLVARDAHASPRGGSLPHCLSKEFRAIESRRPTFLHLSREIE